MKFDVQPENWVDEYADYLFNFAIKRLNNEEEAQDLVQETFLSAWKAREGFEGKAKVKTWLTSILRNKIIDQYRRRASRPEILEAQQQIEGETDFFFMEEGKFEGHWTGDYASSYRSIPAADHNFNQAEFLKVLGLCLDNVPDRAADVFKMKFLEDLDVDEICKAAEITPSNYWVIVHRVKLKLRDCLSKNWIETKR